MSKVERNVIPWILILMAYASLLALGLLDNIRGPFYPDILKDLSLNGTRGSLFYAVASFSALGGNFFGSFMLNRAASHTLMSLSVFGTGLGFWLISQSTSFERLVLACVVFGLSFGLLNVSQNVVLQENAPEKHRRRLFNGLHSMYGMSALAAPLAASLFIEVGMNWSGVFSVLGWTTGLLGVLFFAISMRLHSSGKVLKKVTVHGPIHSRAAWSLIFALGFYLFAELSLSTRLPLWLREVHGQTPEQANWYMAYFCGFLLLSRLIFTTVSFHKISNLFILRASLFLSFVCYAAGILIHPFWATLSGFSMGPFFPVMMDEISKRFGTQASKIIGWSITLGSVMIVIMHFSLGVLTDLFGISKALWIGPFGLTMALIFLVVLPAPKEA